MTLLGFLKSLGARLPEKSCTSSSFRVGSQAAKLRRCEGEGRIEYEVLRNNAEVAYLQLRRNEFKEALEVGSIEVDPAYRERRLGTKLYEIALKEACKLGYEIESDSTRSAFAEAFWRKQVSKGRAECVTSYEPGEIDGGSVYTDPLDNLELSDPDEYERVIDKLPKPQRDANRAGGGEYWPCLFYSTTNACKTTSLAGVKPKKAKKRRK